MQTYGNPAVIREDMAIIPAQGRDPLAVAQDVAMARAMQKMKCEPCDEPGDCKED
jgi:hypothetical protein